MGNVFQCHQYYANLARFSREMFRQPLSKAVHWHAWLLHVVSYYMTDSPLMLNKCFEVYHPILMPTLHPQELNLYHLISNDDI